MIYFSNKFTTKMDNNNSTEILLQQPQHAYSIEIGSQAGKNKFANSITIGSQEDGNLLGVLLLLIGACWMFQKYL